MKKSVLIVDNDLNFLETRAEILENHGYEVFKAASIEAVNELLQCVWPHVMIIDIRLRDDSDDRDNSGLILAKTPAYRTIPKIILTRFPTVQAVREAMGPIVDGLPAAVEFVDKRSPAGAAEMLEAIEGVFSNFVHQNKSLQIHSTNAPGVAALVYLLDPEMGTECVSNRIDELTNLFHRVFLSYEQITLSQIIAQESARLTLKVMAFAKNQVTRQFLVVCGHPADLQQERDNRQQWVPPAGSPVEIDHQETMRYAMTVYTLYGAELEDICTLAEFYRTHSTEITLTALDRLCKNILASWMQQKCSKEATRNAADLLPNWPDLSEDILSRENLYSKMKALTAEVLLDGLAKLDFSPQRLTIHLPHSGPVSFSNPIPNLEEINFPATTSAMYGVIHGQLNGQNILVDSAGNCWLIDFTHVRYGPLVFDFASLESSLKFALLDNLDISTRYEMEQRLISASHLDAPIDTAGLPEDAQKAILAISQIRRAALEIIGDDIALYWVGLILSALSQLSAFNPKLRHTRRDLTVHIHGLLAILMLCQELAKPPEHLAQLPEYALTSLWIDKTNKEVWVEGVLKQLPPTEYALLLLLYQKANQLCPRELIAQEVYGTSYDRGLETALHSTMSRLRRKIESEPAHPKYIENIRGSGYKLLLNYQPPAD